MDAAARAAGAEINQGWEVVSLARDERRVTVTARERHVKGDEVSLGVERTVEVKFVIGADETRTDICLQGRQRVTYEQCGVGATRQKQNKCLGLYRREYVSPRPS